LPQPDDPTGATQRVQQEQNAGTLVSQAHHHGAPLTLPNLRDQLHTAEGTVIATVQAAEKTCK